MCASVTRNVTLGNAALMLAETALRQPQRRAIEDGDAVTDYERLAGRVAGIAESLPSLGVAPGDRVAIMLRRGTDAAASYFGVLAAGAVAVVVNEQLRPRQIEHVLAHSGARLLLSAEDVLEQLPHGPRASVGTVRVADLPSSSTVDPLPRDPSDVAQIVYTSGSTGLPKGVTLSHDNLWAGMRAVVSYLGIEPGDRIASLLPFSFDYGNNQLLCCIATGAALVVERSTLAQRIVRTLREQDVTVLPAVPPLWLQLLDVEGFRSEPIASLRLMTNTGGRLPAAAVRKLRSSQPQAELYLMYGLTEAFRSTYLPPERVDQKPDSIGQAIPEAEVLVLDRDMRPCPPGDAGELVHRGPTVALGYWNDPEASERVFRPDPQAHGNRVVFSGDLVYRDADGDLFFVGREDRLIKTLGYRVSPDEVADVLYASGQVVEALVSSEPDQVRGERIVAHVVLTGTGTLEALEAFVADEMPRYMQPGRIEVHEQLPRTASGKHDPAATARQGG